MTSSTEHATSSFSALPASMQRALELALEAARAGSLAIGAVVTDGDRVVAEGRNRVHESDPGTDIVAGTSLAHAEINALGKLRFRAHEDDDLVLVTTLQPCVQCLGAIRLAPVRHVEILAPDPLWVGVERIREATPFLAARWPRTTMEPSSPWAVLALLSPTRHALAHPRLAEQWRAALPLTSELAAGVDVATLAGSVAEVAAPIWSDLADRVEEVERLAVRTRLHQG